MLNNSISYNTFTGEVFQPSDNFVPLLWNHSVLGAPRAECSIPGSSGCFLCCKHTLLIHGQFFIHQDVQILLCRAALHSPVGIDRVNFLDPGARHLLLGLGWNLMRSTSTLVASTDPWGTLLTIIGFYLDWVNYLSCWLWFFGCSYPANLLFTKSIHLNPALSSLEVRMLWGILSEALQKSRYLVSLSSSLIFWCSHWVTEDH